MIYTRLHSEYVRESTRPVTSQFSIFSPLHEDYTNVAGVFQNNPLVKYRRQNLGKGVNLAEASFLKYLPSQTVRLIRCPSSACLSDYHVPQ